MKESIYKTLKGYKTESEHGKRFDLMISSLIVLNVIAFVLSSYPKIQLKYSALLVRAFFCHNILY